jgi:RES domain-containing protein
MAYRHHAAAYGGLNGEGARLHGGRWNPPDSFAVVYTAADTATVDAEFQRLLARSGLPAQSLQPRQLTTINLDLGHVLDLRDEAVLATLGVRTADLTGDDPTLTRRIGEAAHALGYEAVIAPSAAGAGDVVAIFPANRRPDSRIEVVGVRSYRPGVAD